MRGKNILENEHVKVSDIQPNEFQFISAHAWLYFCCKFIVMSLQIGQFHTLEIDLHRPFVLRKVCISVVSV